MANYEQLSSPYEFVSTTPSATISDVIDAEWNFDPEMNEHWNGASVYPRFTIGNHKVNLKVKTSDVQGFTKFIKGMEVTDAEIKFKSPITVYGLSGNQASMTQASTVRGFKISTTRVVEAVKVSNGADKKPAEFEVTFQAAVKESDGSDPSITLDLS